MTTDADRSGISEELEAGRTYYLKKIEAPFGMRLSEEVYPIALEEGDVRSVSAFPVTDDEWSGRVVVKKAGEADEPLSGAVFGLYEWSETAGEYQFREDLTGAVCQQPPVLYKGEPGAVPCRRKGSPGRLYLPELEPGDGPDRRRRGSHL